MLVEHTEMRIVCNVWVGNLNKQTGWDTQVQMQNAIQVGLIMERVNVAWIKLVYFRAH